MGSVWPEINPLVLLPFWENIPARTNRIPFEGDFAPGRGNVENSWGGVR